MEWGADALFTIENNKLVVPQLLQDAGAADAFENCVAHNGSLDSDPGTRHHGPVVVSGRCLASSTGPTRGIRRRSRSSTAARSTRRGSSAAVLVGVLVQRPHLRLGDRARARRLRAHAERILTQNEIDAAKTVHFDFLNVQDQPKFVWPASFVLARAYTDQLVRTNGLSSSQTSAIYGQLSKAEKCRGQRGRRRLQV